jgi:hypothetical protein
MWITFLKINDKIFGNMGSSTYLYYIRLTINKQTSGMGENPNKK